MLVVTLIAAITVMEAFGVYFFPHGSWSEGINPKALNNFGRAIGEDIPFLMLFLIQMWLIFVTKTKDFGRHLLNFTP
jgi:hypothetical protein